MAAIQIKDCAQGARVVLKEGGPIYTIDKDITSTRLIDSQGNTIHYSPLTFVYFVHPTDKPETVNHPAHYGGDDNPYEAIKVIEAWALGFCLGNTIKYICRAGKKHKTGALVNTAAATLEDLKKARWYLDREITQFERADNDAAKRQRDNRNADSKT